MKKTTILLNLSFLLLHLSSCSSFSDVSSFTPERLDNNELIDNVTPSNPIETMTEAEDSILSGYQRELFNNNLCFEKIVNPESALEGTLVYGEKGDNGLSLAIRTLDLNTNRSSSSFSWGNFEYSSEIHALLSGEAPIAVSDDGKKLVYINWENGDATWIVRDYKGNIGFSFVVEDVDSTLNFLSNSPLYYIKGNSLILPTNAEVPGQPIDFYLNSQIIKIVELDTEEWQILKLSEIPMLLDFVSTNAQSWHDQLGRHHATIDPSINYIAYLIDLDSGNTIRYVIYDISKKTVSQTFDVFLSPFTGPPLWSEKGDYFIAFTKYKENQLSELVKFDLDGKVQILTNLSSLFDTSQQLDISSYSISPDGRYIVFWIQIIDQSSKKYYGYQLGIFDVSTENVTFPCISTVDDWLNSADKPLAPKWNPINHQFVVTTISAEEPYETFSELRRIPVKYTISIIDLSKKTVYPIVDTDYQIQRYLLRHFGLLLPPD